MKVLSNISGVDNVIISFSRKELLILQGHFYECMCNYGYDKKPLLYDNAAYYFEQFSKIK
ncbi:MAG: hypothetical protein AUK64_2308 [bacterium P201]|nr:MAG: hypothetical protein AUK64_2308 [bacterium P201]